MADPIAASVAGDLVKYGVDALNDIRQGKEVRDFKLGEVISNAAFGAVWGQFPGKYVKQFDDYLQMNGGKWLRIFYQLQALY